MNALHLWPIILTHGWCPWTLTGYPVLEFYSKHNTSVLPFRQSPVKFTISYTTYYCLNFLFFVSYQWPGDFMFHFASEIRPSSKSNFFDFCIVFFCQLLVAWWLFILLCVKDGGEKNKKQEWCTSLWRILLVREVM